MLIRKICQKPRWFHELDRNIVSVVVFPPNLQGHQWRERQCKLMENTENHFKTRGRSKIILASIRPLFAWLLQHFLPYVNVVFATLKTLICS